jgi:hypothetical protein
MSNMPWEPSAQAATCEVSYGPSKSLAGDRALIRKLGPSGPRGFTVLDRPDEVV